MMQPVLEESRGSTARRVWNACAALTSASSASVASGPGAWKRWLAAASVRLTSVDMDEVCVSNVNRQLHALTETVGRAKVEVMAERICSIYPLCRVRAIPEFFTASNVEAVLGARYDYVVDAIDTLANKCLLIAACRERTISIVTCGGAGGRCDPTAISIVDLAFSSHDRLLQKVREKLRQEYGFPGANQALGVDCVYSTEQPLVPTEDGTAREDQKNASFAEAERRRLSREHSASWPRVM